MQYQVGGVRSVDQAIALHFEPETLARNAEYFETSLAAAGWNEEAVRAEPVADTGDPAIQDEVVAPVRGADGYDGGCGEGLGMREQANLLAIGDCLYRLVSDRIAGHRLQNSAGDNGAFEIGNQSETGAKPTHHDGDGPRIACEASVPLLDCSADEAKIHQ